MSHLESGSSRSQRKLAPPALRPAPPQFKRILLVDDHKIMRDGIKAILRSNEEFRVTGEAEDGAAAVTVCRRLRPPRWARRNGSGAEAGAIGCRRTPREVRCCGWPWAWWWSFCWR